MNQQTKIRGKTPRSFMIVRPWFLDPGIFLVNFFSETIAYLQTSGMTIRSGDALIGPFRTIIQVGA